MTKLLQYRLTIKQKCKLLPCVLCLLFPPNNEVSYLLVSSHFITDAGCYENRKYVLKRNIFTSWIFISRETVVVHVTKRGIRIHCLFNPGNDVFILLVCALLSKFKEYHYSEHNLQLKSHLQYLLYLQNIFQETVK